MFRNNDVSDGGRRVLVTAPDYTGSPLLTLANCKAALGISGTDQDAVIQAALDAAVATLDPASNGWLGRALGAQSWRLELRSFNDRRQEVWPRVHPLAIPLPYPPLISVTSVKYFDVNGADTTMVLGTDYRVLGMGDPIGFQFIAPLYGKSWPVARMDDASVRITVQCGYDGSTNKPPKQLTQAICLAVRALMPLLARDPMLFEDRVEGVGSKRYQNNPEFARISQDAVANLLSNLSVF